MQSVHLQPLRFLNSLSQCMCQLPLCSVRRQREVYLSPRDSQLTTSSNREVDFKYCHEDCKSAGVRKKVEMWVWNVFEPSCPESRRADFSGNTYKPHWTVALLIQAIANFTTSTSGRERISTCSMLLFSKFPSTVCLSSIIFVPQERILCFRAPCLPMPSCL